MTPSTVRSGPITSTVLPSGIVFTLSPVEPGSRRRLAPSLPVLATWRRWPTPGGVGVGALGGGVDVAKIWETDDGTVGEARTGSGVGVATVCAPGRTMVS